MEVVGLLNHILFSMPNFIERDSYKYFNFLIGLQFFFSFGDSCVNDECFLFFLFFYFKKWLSETE